MMIRVCLLAGVLGLSGADSNFTTVSKKFDQGGFDGLPEVEGRLRRRNSFEKFGSVGRKGDGVVHHPSGKMSSSAEGLVNYPEVTDKEGKLKSKGKKKIEKAERKADRSSKGKGGKLRNGFGNLKNRELTSEPLPVNPIEPTELTSFIEQLLQKLSDGNFEEVRNNFINSLKNRKLASEPVGPLENLMNLIASGQITSGLPDINIPDSLNDLINSLRNRKLTSELEPSKPLKGKKLGKLREKLGGRRGLGSEELQAKVKAFATKLESELNETSVLDSSLSTPEPADPVVVNEPVPEVYHSLHPVSNIEMKSVPLDGKRLDGKLTESLDLDVISGKLGGIDLDLTDKLENVDILGGFEDGLEKVGDSFDRLVGRLNTIGDRKLFSAPGPLTGFFANIGNKLNITTLDVDPKFGKLGFGDDIKDKLSIKSRNLTEADSTGPFSAEFVVIDSKNLTDFTEKFDTVMGAIKKIDSALGEILGFELGLTSDDVFSVFNEISNLPIVERALIEIPKFGDIDFNGMPKLGDFNLIGGERNKMAQAIAKQQGGLIAKMSENPITGRFVDRLVERKIEKKLKDAGSFGALAAQFLS